MRVLVEKQAYQSIQENPEKGEWSERSHPSAMVSSIDSCLCVDTQNHRINRSESDLGTGEDLVLSKDRLSSSVQNSFTIQ